MPIRTSLLAAVAALSLALPAAASAAGTTVAVIGDTPYGAPQVANFPNDIQAINADPSVSRVIHLGDIKNGSSQCTDAYFAQIRASFDTFADPVVYTPGDNEWTDCHRSNNGSYDPLERLAAVRSEFFPNPGWTLGANPVPVRSQGGTTVENVLWSAGGVEWGTVHVVGSNNSLLPWTGNTEPTASQLAEYQGRLKADLRWIDQIFSSANDAEAAGVVVGIQADMWSDEATDGFDQIVRRLAQRAHAFHKPVLLLAGDSHQWKVDHPLTPGDAGYDKYEFPVDAPNLTRVIVQGSTNCPLTYLRLHVDPLTHKVFSGENVLLPLDPMCDATAPFPGGF
jgi:hypothetical protein